MTNGFIVSFEGIEVGKVLTFYRVKVCFPNLPQNLAFHEFNSVQNDSPVSAINATLRKVMGARQAVHAKHPEEIFVSCRRLPTSEDME